MNRREWLQRSAGAALAIAARRAQAAAPAGLTLQSVKNSPSRVVPVDATAPGAAALKLKQEWSGEFCRTTLVNGGKAAVRVKEVVLAAMAHDLPPGTRLYGESFQMLSQTAGTLARPVDMGYSEIQHYKIPQPVGVTALSGMMALSPPGAGQVVLAFSSCRRFIGRFYLRERQIEAVVDTEGLEIAPGETWELEEFMAATGASRPAILTRLAERIRHHHPPLAFPTPPTVPTVPTGWCSWYCFGPRVTAQQVLDNLEVIAKNIPALKYVQIDDGYQPAMGDWLETGRAFGGDVQGVLKEIRRRGFEPAIWVAPFVAEEGSHVFQQHPDWFVKNASGQPLRSNEVTFGGWRRGPWFALDGTHPETEAHLEQLFRTMRQDWGCTYFKLDANFWGAIHGGRFHDPKATRINAYRRGMQAILRGAPDSFILGCNHPLWPSFGLIHGSRSSPDIKRAWTTFEKTARQNLSRNWQNGRLWWNDPDAVLLTGDLPDHEFQFHASVIYATGGMVLSGDDLTKIPPARLAMLRKLLPPTGIAAEFEDDSLQVGMVRQGQRAVMCFFNWGESPQTLSRPLGTRYQVIDFWTGQDLGLQETLVVRDLPGHSARLYICR